MFVCLNVCYVSLILNCESVIPALNNIIRFEFDDCIMYCTSRIGINNMYEFVCNL